VLRIHRIFLLGLCLALTTVAAGVRVAASEPERPEEAPRRRGALLGGVLGRGSGDFDVSRDGRVLSSGWGSGGNIVRGRVGWVLTEDLVLIGEYGVWRRPEASSDSAGTDSSDELGPVDRYVGAGSLTVNLYPHLGGFLLKAGLGYGQASASVVDENGDTVNADAKGPMVILGLGYEYFFSHDMSVVVGADVGRFEGGSELSGNTLQYTVAFQAYFPHGLLREWF
jgi:hypothetical protein